MILMQRANGVKDQEEVKFGQPYENTRQHSKFDASEDLVVVPVEIEIDSMLYNLIQEDILTHFDVSRGMGFSDWVNICFKERMEHIVTRTCSL